MSINNKILVICGPTATGKSALAVEIANLCNGEIISADSRQIYRGLDIGSAKITSEEMNGIPHYLIDVVDPHEIFTVSQFQKLAQEKITKIHARGKLPIICGGTGMYISAIVNNVQFPQVPPDESLRKNLENLETSELVKKLAILDPNRVSKIDTHNRVRLIRAIEIATVLGQVPRQSLAPSLYEIIMIGLQLPKQKLLEKIETRIEQRIPALFDEIKKLHEQGVSWQRLYAFGLEYRYGSEYVQKKISLDEFKKILTTKTWQFAKRQMTWLKRDTRIQWFNPVLDHEKITKLVEDF